MSTKYGHSMLTRTPRSQAVLRRALNRPMTPCLAAVYCTVPASGMKLDMEPTRSRWPSRRGGGGAACPLAPPWPWWWLAMVAVPVLLGRAVAAQPEERQVGRVHDAGQVHVHDGQAGRWRVVDVEVGRVLEAAAGGRGLAVGHAGVGHDGVDAARGG